jgi:hypothetical protein
MCTLFFSKRGFNSYFVKDKCQKKNLEIFFMYTIHVKWMLQNKLLREFIGDESLKMHRILLCYLAKEICNKLLRVKMDFK